jgi:potassium uptake Trk family protein
MAGAAMLEPIVAGGRWMKERLPFPFRLGLPHFNFIGVHYIYMIGFIIATSIMLYPAGLMSYTDALFFAAGSATQSGLNTIDVNKLYLYQQVIFILVSCLCNPIFINTAVVVIRLYWFEKRFKHIVKEARNSRKTVSKSRSKSMMAEDDNPMRMESGVNGRTIKVLHETTKPNGMSAKTASAKAKEEEMLAAEKLGLDLGSSSDGAPTPPNARAKDSVGGSDYYQDVHHQRDFAIMDDDEEEDKYERDSTQHHLGLNPMLLNRDILFADEITPEPRRRRSTTEDVVPELRDVKQHIAFVQKQQKKRKEGGGTLRIPGPRDFDRGEIPKTLDDPNGDELQRQYTKNTLHSKTSSQSNEGPFGAEDKLNGDDHPAVRRGITIDVPEHPAHRQREEAAQATADETNENEHAGSRFGLDRIMSPLRHRRTRSHGVNMGDRKSTFARTFNTLTTMATKDKIEDPMPYLSWQPTLGRNSAFVNLTAEQREELGGIEYRALKTLLKVLVGYFVGFHVLGMVVLLPWIMHTEPYRGIVVANGVAPSWWGVFTPASMFTDLGFTVTADSMVSFQTATLPLLFGSFLIIIGNTGFPCMLRFIIWSLSLMVPRDSSLWEELRFLLDHPRRCFTLLFPSKATWWLFWILVTLNVVDLVLFIILDLNDETVTSLSLGYRFLNGWFQATSTRTAGFSSVSLADLHPAVQVSYMVMMYISVFPIAISVRRTNVYEERSLGIWGGEEADETDQSYVGQHLRRQLSFDLWYLFLGLFIICIVEGDKLSNTNEYAFTMFSVLFEIVSAYGTVGLSLGYPGTNASLSGQFKVISKLVIIAMMLRGRHRGLPYALDRAILLPSENLHKKEAEEATRRHQRRNSLYPENTLEDGNATLGSGSPQMRRRATWEDGDLDENGLPLQHLAMEGIDPMRVNSGTEGVGRKMTRRGSGFSTVSKMERFQQERRHTRNRSLGRFVASGLGAGPTFSKHE